MSDLIVKGGTIVTVDPKRRIIEDGAIVITDNKIEFVGKRKDAESKYRCDKEIDANKKVIFPGLINAHDHMFQVLLRNLGPDLPLLGWLDKYIYPLFDIINEKEEYAYAAGSLGVLENIKSGNTFVIDDFAGQYYDFVIKAMIEGGIRGCLSRGTGDLNVPESIAKSPDESIDFSRKMVKKWHGAANGRITIGISPIHPYNATRELLVKAKELSDELGIVYHTHTGETKSDQEWCLKIHGKTDVELLEELGVLGPRYMGVHSVWVSQKEIGYIARAGAHVVHNPVSNMYLGSGVAPIPEMRSAGVNVALGSDGPASNNNQDLIQSMKFAACLHKVNKLNPAIITAQDVLEMATINGARALGLEKQIGSLEVGKKADLILVDMEKPHIAPVHDPVASLVYCANGSDVETVIVDGKVVMEKRQMKTLDERKVIEKSYAVYGEIEQKFRER